MKIEVTDEKTILYLENYYFKTKDKEKQAKKKHIQQWMKEHKSFVKAMDDTAFEIAKGAWSPNDKFDAVLVKEMLSNFPGRSG